MLIRRVDVFILCELLAFVVPLEQLLSCNARVYAVALVDDVSSLRPSDYSDTATFLVDRNGTAKCYAPENLRKDAFVHSSRTAIKLSQPPGVRLSGALTSRVGGRGKPPHAPFALPGIAK
jgi:hypothetical protein